MSSEGTLLNAGESPSFTVLNPDGRSPFVLVCEHAANAVPASLGRLGLAQAEHDRHIGWDIGAAGVTRQLSDLLDAPAVLQRYSRLVIDSNRPRNSSQLVPERSDGTDVPANRALSETAIEERWQTIHQPFHTRVAALLDRRPRPVLVAIHSFTPRLRSQPGLARPMHVGLLHGVDARLAKAIATALLEQDRALPLAFNEPYAIDDASDYTIPVHGLGRGILNVLIEIRQDLVSTAEQQAGWAARLFRAFSSPALVNMIEDNIA